MAPERHSVNSGAVSQKPPWRRVPCFIDTVDLEDCLGNVETDYGDHILRFSRILPARHFATDSVVEEAGLSMPSWAHRTALCRCFRNLLPTKSRSLIAPALS